MGIGSIKAAVRRRDGYLCTGCGVSQSEYAKRNRFLKRLEVHRVQPGSLYTVAGCVTLCKQCHRRRHPGRAKGPARMSVTMPRDVWMAVKIRALKKGVHPMVLVNELLKSGLTAEIAEVANAENQ